MNAELLPATFLARLPPRLTLLEYGTTCLGPDDADVSAALYARRESLEPYLKERLLEPYLGFGGEGVLRAAHYVGLLPFSESGQTHLLLIAPKGCRANETLGLQRFLELIALPEVAEVELPDVHGLEGARGPAQFLLFQAHWYAHLLTELCQRDFRSFYRHEEDELRSCIRGRLRLPQYARLAMRGKPHVLPCRWDEFTVDNWDNRVLWAAARRLKLIAGALDPDAATKVWEPFRRLIPWFSGVAEVNVRVSDFNKCRLGRTSLYYRRALAWVRLLLQGSELPTHGGRVPPLVLNANNAFEKFAQATARASLPDDWESMPKPEAVFVSGRQRQTRKPDILLSHAGGATAVGDAKYKEVLERATDEQTSDPNKMLDACIQAADWNQLYVYMRMCQASFGFFVVPFWNAAPGAKSVEWITPFEFHPSPCDGEVRVAALALNLLKPLRSVKQEAAERLRGWLSKSDSGPYSTPSTGK